MSQSDLAKEIGVSLRTIQLYEKKDANIPIKNLTKISIFFDVSIAELYLQEVNENGATYKKRQPFTKKGNVFYPMEHGKYLVKVPLVLMEQQKEYIDNLNVAKAEKKMFQTGFTIDFLPESSFMAFEVSGDSMNDGSINAIPNKAIILGLKQEKGSLLRTGNDLWNKAYVIVCTERIICKWITGFNNKQNKLQCQNLNKSPEYQDFELSLNDVLEIFEVVKKQF